MRKITQFTVAINYEMPGDKPNNDMKFVHNGIYKTLRKES
jgi:hypothetical protein